MNDYMIFTDLDGTLLDHHDYSFAEAMPALKKIKGMQIPLIINSSKTFAEIKQIREKMHINWAFSVENGAAIFLPEGKLSGTDKQMEQIILGVPYPKILNILKTLREIDGFAFKGFNDFSVKELMLETGLPEIEATQAKQRLASEPLLWLGGEGQLKLFEEKLNHQGLQLIQGGRFLHVMGENDKSTAMAWLLNRFNIDSKTLVIALGDSQNDLRMLEQADYAAIIRKQNGDSLKISKSSETIVKSKSIAPMGWQEAIDELFKKLNIG